MFDINPDTHRFYLSDLERACARSRRQKASVERKHRRISRRSWSDTLLICVALILITNFTGMLLW